MDDTLLWSDTIEESYFQAVQLLDIMWSECNHHQPREIRLQRTHSGLCRLHDHHHCDHAAAVPRGDPEPRIITDVRSWFGLVNQVAFAFSMSERMHPFRKLLNMGDHFTWSPELKDIFLESKDVIVQEIERGVSTFDKTKPTCIATDWSNEGIGFWLFQKHCQCSPIGPICCNDGCKITLDGSRFTHAADSRYAPIESEALAVTDALDKARYFVLGCDNLNVAVDHKTLLKLVADRSLDDIPNSHRRNLKRRSCVIASASHISQA